VNESELSILLGNAGLHLIGRGGDGQLPVAAAWLATSARPEDGRRDELVDKNDPELVVKANQGWYRLAEQHGLFTEDRLFLLGVDFAGPDAGPLLRWVTVKLGPDWDVMGAGAASGVLGSGVGMPEFVMLRLDGSVIVRGTTWQRSIGSLVLPNPRGVPVIASYVERLLANPATSPSDRRAAAHWLGP
jgi:hypothetical protein